MINTVVQELIEEFNFYGAESITGYTVAKIIKEKLEKEKKQIQDAFDAGSGFDGDWEKEEKYFNEKYNPNE